MDTQQFFATFKEVLARSSACILPDLLTLLTSDS